MIQKFEMKKLLLSLEDQENLIPYIGSEEVKYEPAEPSKETSNPFRIYAKRLFLTYSRTNLSPIDALNQLQSKFSLNFVRYVISQENHVDEPEKGQHLHVFLEFDRKVQLSSSRKLDLIESNKNIHGDYQSVKNVQNVVQYIKKDGNFISNFETDAEVNLKLFQLAKDKGLSEAMNYFAKVRPELVCVKYKKIESNLKAFLDNNCETLLPQYTDFSYPDELLNWFNFEKDEKTLFLTGPSGTGKTEGLINLLKDFNPILITDINALKNLKPEHRAIILDDIDWSTIPRESKIHLLNKSRSANIKIIYQSVKVPSSSVKAVISNKKEDLLSFFDEDKAIIRRIRHVEINKPMFQQNNVFINVSVNNF